MNPRLEESLLIARDRTASRRRRPSTSRRTVLIAGAVGFPVSIALLALSLRHVDGNALQTSLRGADPRALTAGVVAILLVYVAQAARWRVISVASGPSLGRFLEWVVAGIALNNVIPGRPGDLARVEWLSRGARVTRTRALATVGVDRGFDLVTLVGALALTYPVVDHTEWLRRLWLAGGAVGILVGLVLIAAVLFAGRTDVAPTGRIRSLLADAAVHAAKALRGRRGLLVATLSVIAWCMWAVSAWFVASSLGIHLGPLELLFVTAVLNLGVAIPSSPGFIGTYQWLGVSALAILGVPHAEAFAFAVLMHAAWFVPTTIAGAGIALRKLPPVLADVLTSRPSENHAA